MAEFASEYPAASIQSTRSPRTIGRTSYIPCRPSVPVKAAALPRTISCATSPSARDLCQARNHCGSIRVSASSPAACAASQTSNSARRAAAASLVCARPCDSAKATKGSSVPQRSNSRNQKAAHGRFVVARQVCRLGVSSAPALAFHAWATAAPTATPSLNSRLSPTKRCQDRNLSALGATEPGRCVHQPKMPRRSARSCWSPGVGRTRKPIPGSA